MTNTLPKGQPSREDIPFFEVIIIGGSFSGLAAAMSLGRALRNVLVIDDGKPCNRFAPHSHNFLTQDGVPPAEILKISREQLKAYSTVHLVADRVLTGHRNSSDYILHCLSGKFFRTTKLLFATGLRDIHPDIPGFSDCWGASIIHCPFCHGYEYKGAPTGILANGPDAMHYAQLLSQWTNQLSIFTNGPSTLSPQETQTLQKRGIKVYEAPIANIQSTNRSIQSIELEQPNEKASSIMMDVLYHSPKTEQSCPIPETLGCLIDSSTGLLQLDSMQQTTVTGVYASGDNSGMRSVATAVGSGTFAGAAINFALLDDKFAEKESHAPQN